MVKDFKEFNEELLKAYAPSGYEKESISIWNTHMMSFDEAEHVFTDAMWNSVWAFGETVNPKKKILIEGHMDSCSFLVSNITENGYLHIIRQGGVDKKTIYSGNFEILTRTGRVKAFCPKKAIHLEEDEERDKCTFKIENFVLDCGATNPEEVASLGIQVGDCVVYRNDSLDLSFGVDGKFAVGQNLDDKAAIMCLYNLALLFNAQNKTLKDKGYCVYLAASTSEETGCRGAHHLALALNPDYSISIDCTHAVVGEVGGKTSELNSISLEKGLVLNFSPSSYRELVWELQDLARWKSIPYQL